MVYIGKFLLFFFFDKSFFWGGGGGEGGFVCLFVLQGVTPDWPNLIMVVLTLIFLRYTHALISIDHK